ncbi:hypothetical protein Golob_001651 [Gossypium lobatum]|uniref:RNase H type-1 domain-containing protein n=1 Tax=Gossypium lobatum TaxID=34289 RepID=A0A7J8NC64_9ROSI|nr:hypothetical protein [Gossypium lobatum]
MLTESSWWGSPKDSAVLTRRIDNRLTMEWEPPSPDFLKFNADGATVECPGMTGSGGVLRDDKGAMLAMFYGLLGSSLPFVEEIAAINLALTLFIQSKRFMLTD